MAEIVDKDGHMHSVATNAKANTGLGFGIAGTALGILGGGLATLLGTKAMNGGTSKTSEAGSMSAEDLYIERKECQDYLDITKEFYQGKLENQERLTNAFFEAYKRDIDNSFSLYKSQRDGFDLLNEKIIDTSFNLYKNQRDEKDKLVDRINAVDKKVDMMAAIRPYQDALINAKIDNTALVADFNLARRTCRMIQGEVVLPSSEEITGYPSNPYCCGQISGTSN